MLFMEELDVLNVRGEMILMFPESFEISFEVVSI